MGTYAMIIHADGPHDSDGDGDADRFLAQFAGWLEDAGHEIISATLVTGSRIRKVTRDGSGARVLTDTPAAAPDRVPEPPAGPVPGGNEPFIP